MCLSLYMGKSSPFTRQPEHDSIHGLGPAASLQLESQSVADPSSPAVQVATAEVVLLTRCWDLQSGQMGKNVVEQWLCSSAVSKSIQLPSSCATTCSRLLCFVLYLLVPDLGSMMLPLARSY